jgi:hypothetical protein
LPGLAALVVGFLALAYAVPNEFSLPTILVTLFCPGLKLAELITPERHESIAWSFGWFLRIAILGNGLFYFVVFTGVARLLAPRRSQTP